MAATAPWGTVDVHGGGAYGEQAFLLTSARASENPHVGLYTVVLRGQELSAAIRDALPPPERRAEIHTPHDIPELLQSGNYDRFYSPVPYYLAKHEALLRGLPVQIRATLHGTRYLELGWDPIAYHYRSGIGAKGRHFLKRFLAAGMERREIDRICSLVSICDGEVLTVSPHTRSTIELLVPNASAVEVAQLAPPAGALDAALLPSSGKLSVLSPDEYFLVVSSNRVEKNAWRVLQALSRHLSGGLDGKRFVFLGMDKALRSRFERELGGRNDVLLLDYVKHEEYRALLANCFALVYPSLSEGFGYPPVEAMRYGKPSIVSGTTAMPTVYKGGVLFVDPRSPREIASRMHLLVRDKELYQHLVDELPAQLEALNAWFELSRKVTVDYITA